MKRSEDDVYKGQRMIYTIVRWALLILLEAVFSDGFLSGIAAAENPEGRNMQGLELRLDGRPVAMETAVRLVDEEACVPLKAFCRLVGAKVEEVNGGQLTVCKGDLCVPIQAEEVKTFEGVIYAPLDGFGEALGLSWGLAENVLKVRISVECQIGLSIGQLPPEVALPDLYTGERVSPAAYRGKKAIFYMWASW